MTRKGVYSSEACPRCGASPCHQRYKERRDRVFVLGQHVTNLHPADGVLCPKCGFPFFVSKLDCDDGYIQSDTENHAPFACRFTVRCPAGDASVPPATHEFLNLLLIREDV